MCGLFSAVLKGGATAVPAISFIGLQQTELRGARRCSREEEVCVCLAGSARRCQSSEGGFGGDLGTYFCGARFGMNGFKDSFTAQSVRACVGKYFHIFVISLPVEGNVVCWWSRPLWHRAVLKCLILKMCLSQENCAPRFPG